jgi:integrase
MARAKKNRGAPPPQRFLNEQDAKKLLLHVRTDAARGEANGSRRAIVTKMIIEMMLYTGLRAEELCCLRICDLPHYHHKPVVFVFAGKGNVSRSIEVSEWLADQIEIFVKVHRRHAKPSSPLFVSERGYRRLQWVSRRRAKADRRWLIEPRTEHTSRLSYHSLYRQIRRVGKAADIGKLHPHMLRHTAMSMLYSLEHDIKFVQSQAGHAKIETTQQYIHTSMESRRKQIRAYDSLLSSPNC